MRVNANAVLRSWTLLAAFGGSYATHICILLLYILYIYTYIPAICITLLLGLGDAGETVTSVEE